MTRQKVTVLDSLETRAGDVHFYPNLPWDKGLEEVIRSLGSQAGPVFLSEFGNGSLFNVIREYGYLEHVPGDEISLPQGLGALWL